MANLRTMLIQRIHEVIESVSKTYRTEAKIEVLSDVPAVVSNADLNQEIISSIKSLDETVALKPLYHVMGSEDFAFISEKVPSSYFCIGAGLPDKSKWFGQHNPKVRFIDECLPLGAAVYAKAAMDWLNIH